MEDFNPFVTKGYASKELFCDRKKELKNLLDNAKNGLDTTLFADRKMGKTGLIYRFFDYLGEKNSEFANVYVDIFSSRCLDDFVRLLSEAILRKYPEKTSFGKAFMKILKSFRPLISYDAVTGEPQVMISYQNEAEKHYTLKGILDFLETRNVPVVLAIDEFQQITEYPETNIEALLRTYVQQVKNIRFIFCGSKTSLITEMFSSIKRPFFNSTSFLHLDKIDEKMYFDFIKDNFEKHKKKIDDEAIQFILEWTLRHTFYTQFICNQTFNISKRTATIVEVKQACKSIFQQNEAVFLQYRRLLTPAQWNFLIATAKEEILVKPTAKDFLMKHNIGTPAHAKRLLNALIDKDLIVEKITRTETNYYLYDVFLLRWMQSVY
ncbi:MAG: ATP-binding protein [Bacteroidetes bacterium]|nr:ATP-binding protein [Bacteroidota bacterium]